MNINNINLSVNKNISFKNKEIATPKQKIEQSKDEFNSSVNNKEQIAKTKKIEPLKNAVLSGVIGAGITGIFVALQYLKTKKIDKEMLLAIPEIGIGFGTYNFIWGAFTNPEKNKT